jgi:acetyltransferase, GNAT family
MQTDDFAQLLKGLSFFRLKEGYTIKPFDCGDDDLNEFLFEEAVPYRKQLLATTFVIENDERTLGYYSLLNDSLLLKEEMFSSKSQYNKFRRELLPYPKRHLNNVPSLKIGRLAIDKTFKGKGLGRIIIDTIINHCVDLNEDEACRLITVDAYAQAVSFYQKIGFEFLTKLDEGEETRLMFLDLISFL